MVRGSETVNHGWALFYQFLQPGSRLLQLSRSFNHFHSQRIFALPQKPLGLFAARDVPAYPYNRLRPTGIIREQSRAKFGKESAAIFPECQNVKIF